MLSFTSEERDPASDTACCMHGVWCVCHFLYVYVCRSVLHWDIGNETRTRITRLEREQGYRLPIRKNRSRYRRQPDYTGTGLGRTCIGMCMSQGKEGKHLFDWKGCYPRAPSPGCNHHRYVPSPFFTSPQSTIPLLCMFTVAIVLELK